MTCRRFRIASLASCAVVVCGAALATSAQAAPAPVGPGIPAAPPAPPAPGTPAGPPSPTGTTPSTGPTGSNGGGAITPAYGRISPFYGNVSALYGRISPFYGRISPFYGRISAFWGDTTPFTSAAAAYQGTDYDAFWGTGPSNPYKGTNTGIPYAKIGGFWKTESASWAKVDAAWDLVRTPDDATKLANMIQTTILDPAWTFWSAAAKKGAPPPPGTTGGPERARYTAYSALSGVFKKAGITFNADHSINAASLTALTPADRDLLFLNVYDRLMDFAGTGHVDWWMGAVNWSPALAQTQGTVPAGGSPPTVGMLDFVVSSGTRTSKQLIQYGSSVDNGHGAAVGSLIMGAVDGSGVMGVVPQDAVNVVVYDPYDTSNTTNWDDIGKGVAVLTSSIFKGKTVPVGVLNASLGVKGWTLNSGWNDALASAGAHGHNLVIAAGNDGTTQTQDVVWNLAKNPTLIIVGSVGVDGSISPFSNRPGEACLLASAGAACAEADKLKNHFIVAPGEFILVSDGKGGHVRQSGTSLAAPLVSGAIALLQNRWPWLAKYSDETASIILGSATPKGKNPGSDVDYGVGELNILASQSPLDWNSLTYRPVVNGKASPVDVPLSGVLATVRSGTQASFDSSKLYISAIETIGRTIRDFQIPLSSKLVGQRVKTKGGDQLYQSYLSGALRDQATRLMADAATGAPTAPLSFRQDDGGVRGAADVSFNMRMSLRSGETGFMPASSPYQTDASVVGEGFALRFGYGGGAPALDGHAAFGLRSDYQSGRGGANPLLGLASGGAYVGGQLALAPRLNIALGMTQRNDVRNLSAFGISTYQSLLNRGLQRYHAQAQQASMDWALSDRFAVRLAVTALQENDAILGIQSLDPADFGRRSATAGSTLGFDYVLPHGLTLSGAGSITSTRSRGGQLTTGSGGLRSTAAEAALAKQRLFGLHDQLRIAVSMPMHAIGGRLRYATYGVVDRATGELGVVSQDAVAGSVKTPLAAEMMYGRALPGLGGLVSVFGRLDANGDETASGLGIAAGTQLRVTF